MNLPFMFRHGEQKYITENYVSIPPALIITDEAGNIWTLGFKMGPITGGEYTFDVLKNGIFTGEFANRIERRKSEIWIFGPDKWKRMKVHEVEPTYVYAIKVSFNDGSKIEAVTVSIYWNNKSDIPIISFSGNSAFGFIDDRLQDPIICKPGQWLYAVIEPIRFDVSVTGYIGNENLRVIPIRGR